MLFSNLYSGTKITYYNLITLSDNVFNIFDLSYLPLCSSCEIKGQACSSAIQVYRSWQVALRLRIVLFCSSPKKGSKNVEVNSGRPRYRKCKLVDDEK